MNQLHSFCQQAKRLYDTGRHGQNQIAIHFNSDLNRIDDSIKTSHNSIKVVCDKFDLTANFFNDLFHETCNSFHYTRIYLLVSFHNM